jgi:8-oxo-dGTP diphosphatase
MSAPQRIGIAIVEHAGRYLVGIRPEGVPLAGYAEFPGGKCEADEPTDACAVRECHEETGLAVAPVRLLQQVTHTYPHGTVELSFWLCRPVSADIDAAEHHGFRWVSSEQLAALRFPEANAGVIALLIDDNNGQDAQG